ncbi:unnamed protein product [Notodromas monacha]|uniref:Zinc finger C2H2 LYAR-type domain-containing protein n=1 Tax=Notodromas monacha TaxID=399045 RepID=A0A7R9GJC3_9CRUS|nr:unnamed protein product [Notodromas monacha]CAG0924838.1 unnamed protein product [Notodromas monacha]
MVVFACNACGSSLKKNQVEKHYLTQCRKCESVSCMDCNKDFWGDEFKEHTKCITENEKYGGKNYQAKPSANKGEKKQEAWTEHVQSVLSSEASANMNPRLRTLLESVSQYPNVPRKKAKFENFVKNSIFCKDPQLISQAWDIFSSSKPEGVGKPQPEAVTVPAESSNDKENLSKREKKELRRKEHDKVEKKDKRKQIEDADTKPSKKRKRQQSFEENGDDEDDLTGSQDGADSGESEPQKKSKKKKQKELRESQEIEDVERENGEEEELEVETPVKPRKFKWESVITEALTSAGGELPVKKHFGMGSIPI